ncbi:MAG: exodeoxyribonuclease V subunit alpha [Betaproteobacteria bacterium]|nr:exodeoxyribonuclease V subunit alpha [Betaproteobacteria bacterium]
MSCWGDPAPQATPDMTRTPLTPTVADGFAHLDVELADLLRRHLAAQGLDTTSSACQWWCAAAALTSRACSSGHSGLELGQGSSAPWIDLLSPAAPSLAAPLQAYAARFVQQPLVMDSSEAQRAVLRGVQGSGLLVLDDQRLYLRRLWAAECRVAQALATRSQGFASPAPQVDERAEALLKAWFESPDAASNLDQQEACRRTLRNRLTVLTGGPGSGKTYTAARMLALLQATRPGGTPCLQVALAAPTGKAAARLRQSMEEAWRTLRGRGGLSDAFWNEAWSAIQAPQTVHALLATWRRDARSALRWFRPPDADGGDIQPAHTAAPRIDLLLVDEASMLDLELLDEVLRHLPVQARLVLVGDRDQLASVEAGSVLSDICGALEQQEALSTLQHSRRFQGTIGDWARGIEASDPATLETIQGLAQTDRQALINEAAGPQGWWPFFEALAAQQDAVHEAAAPKSTGNPTEPAMEGSVRTLLTALDRFRVLAAVRQGPWGVESLNQDIERALAARGALNRSEAWPHGRVLMVTRNDESSGLRNGDVGVVLHRAGTEAQFAWIAGHDIRRLGVSRLPPVEPAYAMTVHKSQGSEFDSVVLALPQVDSPVLSRELLYTGLTRARARLTWYLPERHLLTVAAGRSTRRMSGLQPRLRGLLNRAGH